MKKVLLSAMFVLFVFTAANSQSGHYFEKDRVNDKIENRYDVNGKK